MKVECWYKDKTMSLAKNSGETNLFMVYYDTSDWPEIEIICF